MIDLGKYALPVLLSYGAAITLLLGLLILSIMDQRKARAAIRAIEGARK